MTRQELLTELATECKTWDEAISQALSHEWFLRYTQGWTELRNHLFTGIFSGIFVTDWLAERERLLNKPSWDGAPVGSTHLAMGKDGVWFVYTSKPYSKGDAWVCSRWCKQIQKAIAIPAGYNWRESLEERPS